MPSSDEETHATRHLNLGVSAPGCRYCADAVAARERRRALRANTERRRAARALDRYIEMINAGSRVFDFRTDNAGADFVEAVGDYVLSRMQQKSDYGASGGPGELFGADAHGGAPDGIGSLPFEGCDWPAMQCSGHYSIRALPHTTEPVWNPIDDTDPRNYPKDPGS